MPQSAMITYTGFRRTALIAVDVGTTFSGVSYTIMDPGAPVKIQSITRFPGQESVAGDAKIPSILYYDHYGDLRAVGAEAKLPATVIQAEDEDWFLVEWFKLHLRPDSLDSGDLNRQSIPQLPRGKGVIQVLSDFLKYLFQCAQRFITETHMNGRQVWSSVEDSIEFIFSHPNGWEGIQQQKMRRAAVLGGLIRDNSSGLSRIHFVTEGEASLQFCIRNGLGLDRLTAGEAVMIIDAGGGTIDISSYSVDTVEPLSVEEITSPDCVMQGSVSVNARAYRFFKELLQDSHYGSEDDLRVICDSFDKSAKLTFKDRSEQSYIRFGSMRCNDPAVNIRRGQLMISGNDMASFFEPCIKAIVTAVQQQRRTASKHIDVAFLVGGFAASPWLYSRLEEALQERGIDLCRPDAHTGKAVSEGAASFYLEHYVSVRVSRLTYGIEIMEAYDSTNSAHVQRKHHAVLRPSGRLVMPNVYSVVLPKGNRMREGDEVSMTYYREDENASALSNIAVSIESYRGPNEKPHWKDIESPSDFVPLCTVRADTSGVHQTPESGSRGVYYKQRFKIVMICGFTEMKAQISWIENGVEKRGPAEIVYDEVD